MYVCMYYMPMYVCTFLLLLGRDRDEKPYMQLKYMYK